MRRNATAIEASSKRAIGETHMDGKWLVDTILPGLLEAHAGLQFGAPCLVGTRTPTYVGLGWVWECYGNAHVAKVEGLSQIDVVALAAFDAGVQWQRSRKRRQRMKDAVTAGWEQSQ